MNKRNYIGIGLIFLDLKKAFHTVDLVILLDSCKIVVMPYVLMTVYSSYMLRCPSRLHSRPTFILSLHEWYRDFPTKCRTVKYVDDTALLYTDRGIYTVRRALCEDVKIDTNWLVRNCLTLTMNKIKMLIAWSESHKVRTSEPLDLKINNQNIRHVNSFKDISVWLHINWICRLILQKLLPK